MTDMTAFESMIAEDARDEVGPEESVDAMAITRQAMADGPRWSGRSIFSATKFAVAGVIVALFGGFLLAGILLTQQNDESLPPVGASASPTPDAISTQPKMLPAQIPTDVTSGTLDTPLGAVRWVHIEDNLALQEISRGAGGSFGMSTGGAVTAGLVDSLVSSPGGFAMLTRSDDSGQPDAVSWSPDLLSWTESALPTAARDARLTWTGDQFWLAMSGPASLWRSPDTEAWVEVPLGGVRVPGVPGLGWHKARSGLPITSGATTIVPVVYGALDTVSYLGLSETSEGRVGGTFAALSEGEPGSYWAEDDHGGDYGSVRFEETTRGLRVIDAETGAVRAELEGVAMDLIEGWAAQRNRQGEPPLKYVRLAVVGGEGLTQVDAPMSPWAPTILFGGTAGFTAYQKDAEAGLIHAWHSEDGIAWLEAEPLGDDADEPPFEAFHVLRAAVDGIEALDPNAGVRWTSTDGLAWASQEVDAWRQADYSRQTQSQPWPLTESHPRPVVQGPVDEDVDPPTFTRIASGFVRLSGGDYVAEPGIGNIVPVVSLMVQGDGEQESTAVDVTELGLRTDDSGERDQWSQPLVAISGNTVVLNQETFWDGDDGGVETWIFTFDELPA